MRYRPEIVENWRGGASVPLVVLLATLMAVGASAQEQVSSEVTKRLAIGKRIYLEGRASDDSDEEIMIGIGDGNAIEVPAWTLPCGTCHGADGRGGIAVQDVSPPDIRWPALKAPADTEIGRSRPAYADREALRRAVTEGVDAGGTALSAVMPRFKLDDQQWQALVAYLETLASQ